MSRRSHLVLGGILSLCANVHGQTYFKTLGEPGRNERALVVHRTPDDLLFIGGSVGDSALVQRIDADGNVLWARTFKPPGQYPKHIFQLTSAPDGTIIGCGNGLNTAQEPREGFHFRMDVNGNFIWLRHWSDGTALNRRIQPISSTEYLLFSDYYASGSPTQADIFQARIDAATGDVLWMSDRLDLYSAVPYIDDIIAVASLHGSQYATGRIFTNGSPLSTCRVILSKFDNGGVHAWTRYLLYPNNISRRMYGTDIIASDDSLTISYLGDITGASSNFSVGLIRMDTLGNVAWARDFNVVGSTQELSSKVIATSFGYLLAGRSTSGVQKMFLLAVSFSGDLLWAKNYGPPGQVQVFPHVYTMNLTDLGTGFLLAGVVQAGTEQDMLLIRTDEQGDIGCSSVGTLTVNTTVLPTATFPSVINEIPFSLTLGNTPGVVVATEVSDACSLIPQLGGDTTVCGSLMMDVAFPGASYSWQDGSTGSTFEVTASGTYWVTTTIGCCARTDSITVNVSGPNIEVDLGPDTLLCPEEQLILVAAQGGQIQWQDGSSDPQYVVTAAGIYWVTVGAPGCSVADTIVVDYAQLPTIDLGPDTLLCGSTPLGLGTQAPVGSTVAWQDGSSGPAYVVTEAGTYWVTVGFPGCSVTD
ncbi:MAG TPA: hypothetical protein VKG92_06520, partial [Flavobacteriales bacterium]|nr:hypothetical protein [Flavobacteriales bacterium]